MHTDLSSMDSFSQLITPEKSVISILKQEHYLICFSQDDNDFLEFLAQCPCPRCLLFESKIPRLGSVRDTIDRMKLIRVDIPERRWDIEHVNELRVYTAYLDQNPWHPTVYVQLSISMLYIH
jgi:hypothetical protein